jgi:hypothetical protein
MTEDDFIEMIGPEDHETIKGAVMVLEILRNMDADRLNMLLCQVRLAAPIFPREMVGIIESLEADFSLVLAFIDQAKKYDRSYRMKETWNEGSKTG